jgi:hypothetical protein
MASHGGVVRGLINGVRAVNRKYHKPKIEMTPLVKASVFILRLYLVALVGLMIFKFVLAARG